MSDTSYRWVIVALGGLMGCVALGAMFSLAVFLAPMSVETGWSRAGISFAMTINFLVMAFGSFAWGAASDRWGARIVTLIGAVLLGLALTLASRAASLMSFQLTYGILVGLAASAFFAPMIATVTGWFETRRNLAVSLVSAGMGVAPLTISPLASWLITHDGWRPAMFYIGVLAWVLLIPAAMFVRRPPASAAAPAELKPAAASRQVSVGQALTSPQFLVLGFTFFLCCAAHSGPIFHVVSYATFCGLGSMAAVSVYSVEGLAGLGGRLLLGLLADRYGAKRVLIAALLTQAVAIACYLAVSKLGEFYALAVIFGVAYGGGMPLYASLARDYFGQRIMGTVFGAATMLSSLGMSIGPFAGGWVFDHFGTYAWLYVGSSAVAVGAVLLAFLFPKPVPIRAMA
ncbi:MAG TPA: MFS transporter [Steroidobacteraceae bacterium]|jgi:MFS family permease|nr:MFS transporter [Steroidobacteraceae bacterium]